MQAAMVETVSRLWEMRAPDLPIRTPEEAVILASIVGAGDRRSARARSCCGRLRESAQAGMRLQSDPTVAYGIAPEGLPSAYSRI